jgi:long-chain acyl-CoA synthetase
MVAVRHDMRKQPSSEQLVELARRSTIPGLLVQRAQQSPGKVAYRYKDLGIYQELTWSRLRERVEAVCLGLVALGLRKGDRVAIMGDTCIEWVLADLGAQALGAIVYGVYPTSSPSEVLYLMQNGGARVFIAENQEHLDKVLAVADRLPALERIIVADTRALFMYSDPRIMTFEQLEELGHQAGRRHPQLFLQLVSAVEPSDPAIIVYTSGTTGPPKGAVVSHSALLSGAAGLCLAVPELLRGHHRSVSVLPLAHIFERLMTIGLPLLIDLEVHIGEGIEEYAQTLFEVSPTFIGTVPRYWEKFASQVLIGIENSSLVKRWAYELAIAVARRRLERRWDGRDSRLLALLHHIGWLLVFRPILDKLGLMRVRVALTGAAPIPDRVQALWQMWGVDLRNGYGQTECGGLLTAQQRRFPKPGTAGRSVAGSEVRLAEDGEVLFRGPSVFSGYWQDPVKTAEVLDKEGWVHTGDVGEWTSEGELRLVDRKKDIIVTAGGKNISPTEIETLLKASPYISEAVVFGEGRRYLTALIEIDYDNCAEWARQHDIPFTGFSSLIARPELQKLIEQEVERANAHLARVEQVKYFRIIPKELDPEEEGEPVTPTRKVKRRLMYEKFRELVESMYQEPVRSGEV